MKDEWWHVGFGLDERTYLTKETTKRRAIAKVKRVLKAEMPPEAFPPGEDLDIWAEKAAESRDIKVIE